MLQRGAISILLLHADRAVRTLWEILPPRRSQPKLGPGCLMRKPEFRPRVGFPAALRHREPQPSRSLNSPVSIRRHRGLLQGSGEGHGQGNGSSRPYQRGMAPSMPTDSAPIRLSVVCLRHCQPLLLQVR